MQVYDKRRLVAEQEIELSMAEARLRVEGLEAALEQWEERERLKKLRQSLVDQKTYQGEHLVCWAESRAASSHPLPDKVLQRCLAFPAALSLKHIVLDSLVSH